MTSESAQPQAAAPTDGNQDNYLFKRGWRSSMRLNYQHYLTREMAGYLIHPDIPANIPDIRIADVGAGTGIWACEAASQLPKTARIDAFDISSDQFPGPGFRPPNISFHTHDGFTDYPTEFQGQFDIVNARFFVCVVNDPAAASFLEKLVSLVKPGGYLQWFEAMPLQVKAVAPREDVEATFAERTATIYHKPRPDSSYDWTENMAGLFQDAGLIDVQYKKHDWPDHLRPMWMQACLMVAEDVASNLELMHDDGAQRAQAYMRGLEHEFHQGVFVDCPFQCTIGRKPLP